MSLLYKVKEQKCENMLRCPFRAGWRIDKLSIKCDGHCLKKKVSDNWIDSNQQK